MPQYSSVTITELLTANGSCPLPSGSNGLTERIGAMAGFVDDHLLVCGGYSMETQSYLDGCQKQSGRDEANTIKPWESTEATAKLKSTRAFASVLTIEVEFNNTLLYLLGGYNKVNGFLDSVEQYNKVDGTFAVMDSMKLPEAKSHFCTLLVEVRIEMVQGQVEPHFNFCPLTDPRHELHLQPRRLE